MGRIEGVSTAGAVGPMQFLPTTWASCCAGDPTVTRDAIVGAGTYLAQSGGPDDMAAAVYQYNPNDGYVAVVTAYAESLRDEPELYRGYHAFQVFFGTSAGTVRLPVGYRRPHRSMPPSTSPRTPRTQPERSSVAALGRLRADRGRRRRRRGAARLW